MNDIEQLENQNNLEDAVAYTEEMQDELLSSYNEQLQEMPIEARLAMLDNQQKEAEKSLKFSEVLERLHENKDFKEVFNEVLFKNEAVRLVLLRSNLHDSPKQLEKIDRNISMIGELYKWLHAQRILSENAENVLKNIALQRSALKTAQEQDDDEAEESDSEYLDEGI